MSTKPTILDTSTLAQTRLFRVEDVHLRFSNGQERHFERIVGMSREPVQSVMVLPMIDDQTFLLVREYGVGLEQYVLGFPKGAVDLGEAAIETAQRELSEEVGYASNDLSFLTRFAASPAYVSAIMHVYVARDLYADKKEGDEPEPLEVIPWKITEIDSLLSHPEFIESRSVAALYYFQRSEHEP